MQYNKFKIKLLPFISLVLIITVFVFVIYSYLSPYKAKDIKRTSYEIFCRDLEQANEYPVTIESPNFRIEFLYSSTSKAEVCVNTRENLEIRFNQVDKIIKRKIFLKNNYRPEKVIFNDKEDVCLFYKLNEKEVACKIDNTLIQMYVEFFFLILLVLCNVYFVIRKKK